MVPQAGPRRVGVGALELHLTNLGLAMPWTFKHRHKDHEALKPADKCRKIDYPKPDGVVSFDKTSSVYLANVNHEEDQPIHLTLKNDSTPIEINLATYDAPDHGAQLVVRDRYATQNIKMRVAVGRTPTHGLQINAQNCAVHCKTCDTGALAQRPDPEHRNHWVTPEAGGGPTQLPEHVALAALPNSARTGVVTFGHRRAGDCADR